MNKKWLSVCTEWDGTGLSSNIELLLGTSLGKHYCVYTCNVTQECK